MENDEIARYLSSLEREDCYRVDAVLKESAHEVTQRVFFVGANGAEAGPYVRKLIRRDSGLGAAYERIFESQQRGQRFRHIPTISECYHHEDLLVVVMEFVNGETLQDLVYRRDPSLQLAADVFPRLCDAASELHESFDPPLIHRDLKPSNVMLTEGGLMLIDFGIAREYKDGAEADTAKFGTRAFAPPEQFGFGQTTVRSDVYALGMLLYYCLTEKIPTAQVHDGKFTTEEVPHRLRPVLVHATALDPSERYANAGELKAAFLEAAWSPEPTAQDRQAPQSWQAQATAASAQTSPKPPEAPAQVQAGISSKPKLGAWNVFVIVFTALLVFSCWNVAANPADFSSEMPPSAYVLAYGVAEPLLFIGIGAAALKKGPIRQRSHRLRGLQAWHGWAMFTICTLVSLILFGIAGSMR